MLHQFKVGGLSSWIERDRCFIAVDKSLVNVRRQDIRDYAEEKKQKPNNRRKT